MNILLHEETAIAVSYKITLEKRNHEDVPTKDGETSSKLTNLSFILSCNFTNVAITMADD